MIIVDLDLLHLAGAFVDPDVVFFAVLDSGELVVWASPVRVDIGDKISHRLDLLGSFRAVGLRRQRLD